MEPLHHDAASVGRWKREHAALQRRLDTARSFRGVRASAAPVDLGLRLRRGEHLFLVVEHAGLVEPGTSSVDAAPLLDRGVTTITDRRVVFEGTTRRREWALGRVVEHRHYDRRPTTMIEVSNRKRISGIAYEPARAADVRFSFDLALAHRRGTVDALEAELARQLVRHDASRPSVHAGAWVWRGWVRPVPVASAILAGIIAVGAILAGRSGDERTPVARDARHEPSAFSARDFVGGYRPTGTPGAIEPAGLGVGAAPRPTASTPPTAPAAPGGPAPCASVVVLGPAAVPDLLCAALGP
jgi:hypothetical protein